MKVVMDFDDRTSDDEIVIKCKKRSQLSDKIEEYIKSFNDIILNYYKNNQLYYLNIQNIIFFETDCNDMCAHTNTETYIVKHKLYELESLLPKYFVRVSKSTIININHILAISKNITSSSLVEFKNAYKKVYVSRFYYKNLKEKLKERIK